jgi:hypothetical protein
MSNEPAASVDCCKNVLRSIWLCINLLLPVTTSA